MVHKKVFIVFVSATFVIGNPAFAQEAPLLDDTGLGRFDSAVENEVPEAMGSMGATTVNPQSVISEIDAVENELQDVGAPSPSFINSAAPEPTVSDVAEAPPSLDEGRAPRQYGKSKVKAKNVKKNSRKIASYKEKSKNKKHKLAKNKKQKKSKDKKVTSKKSKRKALVAKHGKRQRRY